MLRHYRLTRRPTNITLTVSHLHLISQVPIDHMYWGWNAIGNWVRVSVLVKEAGNYSASFFGTANSGGEIALTVNDYLKTGQGTVRAIC